MNSTIGTAAGQVWKALAEHGPQPPSELARLTGLKSDLLNQAIGWLAREDNLALKTEGKKKLIALRG